MSNDTAKTAPARRVPDAAIAAFTMVITVALVTNPVSLEFLGNVFLPAFAFLGQVFGAIAHAITMVWSWVTPW